MFRKCPYIRPLNYSQQPSFPVPLQHISLSVSIQNTIASYFLQQTFKNVSESPLECEYVFLKENEAVIASLTVFMDETVIETRIQQEEKWMQIYTDEVADRNQGVITKQDSKDLLILNIGNIPSGSIVITQFKILVPVEVKNEKFELMIPAAAFSFYNGVPVEEKTENSDLMIPDDIFPQYSGEPSIESPASSVVVRNYTYRMDIKVLIKDQILEAVCLQQEMRWQKLEDGSTQGVLIGEMIPDNDIVIQYIEGQNQFQPSVVLQKFNGQLAAMISFFPKFTSENKEIDDLDVCGEYIFLLDRSDSMNINYKMQTAVHACILFMQSLPPISRFNIISFGSEFTPMFPQSVKYANKTMQIALQQLSCMSADMGRTNILDPLAFIFDSIDIQNSKFPVSIFLLTDGGDENVSQVIRLVDFNSYLATVHTFGIGKGVSTYLVKEVAKAGRGRCSITKHKYFLKEEVISTLYQSQLPSLSNWKINWDIEFAPVKVKSVYYNKMFRVFGKLQKPISELPVLSFYDSSKQREISTHVQKVVQIQEGEEIMKMWAKNRISDLGESENEVMKLSIQYGVLSKFTCFIGVKKNRNVVKGELQLVKIPIVRARDKRLDHQTPLNTTFEGALFQYSGENLKKSVGERYSGENQKKQVGKRSGSSFKEKIMSMFCMKKKELKFNPFSYSIHWEANRTLKGCGLTTKKEKKEIRKYQQFIVRKTSRSGYAIITNFQKAEGFWNLKELSKVGTIPRIPKGIQSQVWATVVALACLDLKCSIHYGQWVLIYKKGMRYLRMAGYSNELLENTKRLIDD